MKHRLFYCFLAILPLIICGTLPKPLSFGAPVSSTGAPGEQTCTKSGCHDDHELNNGSAVSTILFNGGSTNYTPGKTYELTLKIADASIDRFGFQLIALNDVDNTNAGYFTVTDSVRTQILRNQIALYDRQYVTYTYPGTSAINTGSNEWKINWTAPNKATPVTFYAATLAANDDATDKGDFAYTLKLNITPEPTGINTYTYNDQILNTTTITTPAVYFNNNQSFTQAALIDINGKVIREYNITNNNSLELTDHITNGIYFLRMWNSNKVVLNKLFIALP